MGSTPSGIRPPLAFRVGVVGHRPHRLPEDAKTLGTLQARLDELLTAIQEAVVKHHKEAVLKQHTNHGDHLYAQTDVPVLRAITPLSEGADRLFAQAAKEKGYELFGVFPFPQADYEADFRPGKSKQEIGGSLEEFHTMAADLKGRFVMDGIRKTPEDEARAYRHAGLVVNRQSDVLIAVWDGDHRGRVGGTEGIIEAALREGVIVVWVDPFGEHPWQVLERLGELPLPLEHPHGEHSRRVDHQEPPGRYKPDGSHYIEHLQRVVEQQLEMPSAPAEDEFRHASTDPLAPEAAYKRFCHERPNPMSKSSFKISTGIWSMLKNGLGQYKWPSFRRKAYEVVLREEWSVAEHAVLKEWRKPLRAPFAHADRLSMQFSDRYRAAYISLFLAAAMAVVCAVLPYAMDWNEHCYKAITVVVIEFLILIGIIALWRRARDKQWQEQWLDYRIATELLRQTLYASPIGGRRVLPRLGGPLTSYGDPANTWMAWYVRAWERWVGLPDVRFDPAYLNALEEEALALADEQRKYHGERAHIHANIEDRLHKVSFILGLATLLACTLHLAGSVRLPLGPIHPDERWLVFACACLPALAAALAGINNQGEFKRAAMRNRAMHDRLKERKQEIANLHRVDAREARSAYIAEQISALTELMAQEAIGWRVIFADRPVVPPT